MTNSNPGPQAAAIPIPAPISVATPAAAPAKKKKAAVRARIDPAALAPDLESNRVAVTRSWWYWIGALPECPIEFPTVGGQSFAKFNELIQPGTNGKKVRIPVVGALVRITRPEIEGIAKKLARIVVRFDGPPLDADIGVGRSLEKGRSTRSSRRGFFITIPTKEEFEARAKSGSPATPYEQREFDEPASRYLFAQICDDQENPERGRYYPEPLSVTGMPLPAAEDDEVVQ